MSSENPLEILNTCKNTVWPEIQTYLTPPKYPAQFSIPKSYQSEANTILDTINEYPNRKGKYLRPAFLYFVSQAMGGNSKISALAAAAMQISEEWILIHDDLEDDSLERRGKPALHQQFGLELAVNAGDALHATMWKAVVDTAKLLPSGLSQKFVDEFYSLIHRTVVGQGVEIKWTQENKTDFSDNDWFFLADGKTSYYTIAGPLRLGCIVSNGTDSQLEILTDFGVCLGRCFQLTDDILDLTSDFAGLKKQKGNDIYEGKRTIMLGHLLRHISKRDRGQLIAILQKSRDQKTEQDLLWTLACMEKYGSIEYARKKALGLKQAAQRMFSKLNFISRQPYRDHLETLTSFVLERDH